MRLTWEEEDIKPGMQVGLRAARERLIIGFLAAELGERKFTVTSLGDGMTQPAMTRSELAAWLTRGGWMPAAIL